MYETPIPCLKGSQPFTVYTSGVHAKGDKSDENGVTLGTCHLIIHKHLAQGGGALPPKNRGMSRNHLCCEKSVATKDHQIVDMSRQGNLRSG